MPQLVLADEVIRFWALPPPPASRMTMTDPSGSPAPRS